MPCGKPHTWTRFFSRHLGILMLFTPLLVAGGCDGKMKSDLTRHGFTMGGMLEASEPAEAAVVEESPQAQLYRAGMARKRRGQLIEAVAFFRRAAEKGHAGAAYELGAAYAEGNGVPIDLDLAAQWYNTAAARGEPRAQYLIGAAFYLGAGVEQDQVRAVRYLGDAAVQGNADAQFLLAKAFANGRGVAQDRAWAARWYGKAAYQGHPGAQFSYGAVIAAGRGLPQDLGAAYRWVLLAERAGHPDAPLVRTALARRLDREARAVA